MLRSVQDLEVYKLSFETAMDVFRITRRFPSEERFSLTDQIRRSSRSVAANIREGFAKRRYKNIVLRHFTDALGSAEETRTWLDFGLHCEYLPHQEHAQLSAKCDRICAMLYRLSQQWE